MSLKNQVPYPQHQVPYPQHQVPYPSHHGNLYTNGNRDPMDFNHDFKPESSHGAQYAAIGNHSEKPPLYPDDDADSWVEAELDADTHTSHNIVSRGISAMQNGVKKVNKLVNKVSRGYFWSIVFLLAYFIYFFAAMVYEFGSEQSHRLLVCTVIGVIILLRPLIAKGINTLKSATCGGEACNKTKLVRKVLRWFFYVALLALVVFMLFKQGSKSTDNLRSLPGLFVFLLICLLISERPGHVNWHTIFWAVGLQFLCALMVLEWEVGQDFLAWMQDRLHELFKNGEKGSEAMFGANYKDHYVIFAALPIVFFVNVILSCLYHLGAIQFIVVYIGGLLSWVLDTSHVEAMAVVGGIYMEGLVQVMAVRPYLEFCTKSQLFTITASVFASIGATYLAVLSQFGIPMIYVIPAMIISAPATFAVCKLLMPEIQQEKANKVHELAEEKKQTKYINLMDAAQEGAMACLPLIASVVAITYSSITVISWVNHTLTWFGDRVGVDGLTIEYIFSYLLYPVALCMGVVPEDCRRVAMLLGYRFCDHVLGSLSLAIMRGNRLGYEHYMMKTNGTGPIEEDGDDIKLVLVNKVLKNGFVSPRSEAIATYSLCGFSSILSVCVMMGVLVVMIPKRKEWLAKKAMLILLAGNIANCMTGCFASFFYE